MEFANPGPRSQQQQQQRTKESQQTSISTASPAIPGRNEYKPKRANHACLSCRSRKIRCDAVSSGVPCTNCRLDDTNCEVRQRPKHYRPRAARGRKQRARPRDSSNSSIRSTSEEECAPDSREFAADEAGLPPPSPRLSGPLNKGTFSQSTSEMNIIELMQLLSEPGSLPDESVDSWNGAQFASHDELNFDLFDPFSERFYAQPFSPSPIARPWLLTSYIPELSQYSWVKAPAVELLSPSDLCYLRKAGAFSLPARDILRVFFQGYFLYVHPLCPVLREELFWTALDGDRDTEDENKTSLAVVQALLFAATSFVPSHAISKAGHSSVRAARQEYYNKTRLLLDFGCEEDPLCALQATLILTYWAPDTEIGETRAQWYWIWSALSIAEKCGMNQLYILDQYTQDERRLRRRLWWCCVLRATLISLGLKRPCPVQENGHNIPFPTLEDFEGEFDGSRVFNLETKQTLSNMFVQMTKLAVCLFPVIQLQHRHIFLSPYVQKTIVDLTGQGNLGITDSSCTDMTTCANNIWSSFRKLSEWNEMLPQECANRSTTKLLFQHSAVVVHRNLMHMCYHSALISLYQLHMPSLPQSGSLSWGDIYSTRQLREASAQITNLTTDLEERGLLRFLPTTALALLLPTITQHLLDTRYAEPCPSSSDLPRDLGVCLRALRCLQIQYSGSDSAIHLLNVTVNAGFASSMEVGGRTLRANTPGSNGVDRASLQREFLKDRLFFFAIVAQNAALSLGVIPKIREA